jgi:Pilus formation protein N terminal region
MINLFINRIIYCERANRWGGAPPLSLVCFAAGVRRRRNRREGPGRLQDGLPAQSASQHQRAGRQVSGGRLQQVLSRQRQPLQVISSDANARFLKLGLKKAVVIDLPADIKEVLLADQKTVAVVVRTMRRVYIIGAALGKTNIFFYDGDGRQIVALDVCASETTQLQPPALGEIWHRRQRDRVSQHFMRALTFSEK